MKFNKLPTIISLSDMMFESCWALEFHQRNSHELLHVINGDFNLTLDDNSSFHVSSGETIIIPKGTLHKDVFNLNNDLEIFIVNFAWDLLEEYSKVVTFENINNLDNQVKNILKRIFDQMRFDLGFEELDIEIANSRLLTAFMLIYRDIIKGKKPLKESKDEKTGKNRRLKLVSEAKRYLDKNFANPIQLIDVAEHLKVSPFYLSRIFTRESDFALNEYLTDVRINAAKKLIKDGNYIVADIAHIVGFQQSNYFSKVFKRITGISPSKFK